MNYLKSAFCGGAVAIALFSATTITAWSEGRVYIPMGDENTIVVVENDTGAIIRTIANVPAVHGLAATPDGKFLVAGSNMERAPGTEIPKKPQGMSAADHAKHHPGQMAGKAKAKQGAAISTVSIIRTSDNSVVRRIDVPGAVHHVAISPNGKFAVVTHSGFGGISVIDLETYEIAAPLATGDVPNYAVFSPDNTRLYVSNAGNATVSVIDTQRWIVERNVVVGNDPEHMALSQDGATLYVANVSAGTVSVLDTAAGKVEKTVSIGGDNLHGVALSDDGKVLFVASRAQDRLVSVELESGRQQAEKFAPGPYHVTALRGSDRLYLSSDEGDKVWIIDQKTLKPLGEIEVGGRAHQMVQVEGS